MSCGIYNELSCIICSRLRHSIVSLLSDDLPFDAHLPRLFFLTADVSENGVHLLQRSSHGLGNTEECEHERERTEDCEEGVRAVSGILYKRWGDETLYFISLAFSAYRAQV